MPVPATTGQLRTTLPDMKFGDYILCNYSRADVNFVLNDTTGGEMALTGVAAGATSCYFYLVKVGKGMLVSDRVIANNIPWSTLNNSLWIQGTACSGSESIIPKMTSDTAPSGTAISSSVYSTAFKNYYAFDRVATLGWASAAGGTSTPQYVGYDFGEAKTITAYTVMSRKSDANDLIQAPNTWQFQGYDGSAWVTLDSQSGQTWSYSNQRKTFFISKPSSYTQYRLYVTKNNETSTTTGIVSVGQLKMFDSSSSVFVIRSLSGGVAYMDTTGALSLTDKSLGAWPANNEWDFYVANFPADLIASGKTVQDVFHTDIMSLCQDSIPPGFVDKAAATATTGVKRMARGHSTGIKYADAVTATASAATYGFRPVFEYIEL